MSHKRADRVSDQILREASRLVQEELKDPRIGMVTISHVELTEDLRYARIYYTCFGDEEMRRSSEAGLKAATGFVRRQLGRALRLRFVPEIVFKFDSSLDHSERINTLLAELGSESDGPALREDEG